MPKVDPHLFRAYDIRGRAHEAITDRFCELVGRAFGATLKELYGACNPIVIVGRDARTHSPEFEKAVVDGLVYAGCAVKCVGQTPSPVNYFAICHLGADGGIQITASHNDAEDNGLKLQIRNAEAFAGEDLQGLKRKIEKISDGKQGIPDVGGSGTRQEIDAITPYIGKITSLPHTSNELQAASYKIVADFGNGVTGPVYADVLRQIGFDVIPLFEKPDGSFPNHIADPTQHDTLDSLIKTVKRENADCGIAFDGDGDRVGFVDEKGNIVSADYILLLLAEDYLKRNPGSPVIYTVSMSGILETEITRLGGAPIMCEVGHSFVERAMRKHGSHLGGEQSGHFFCGENYYDYDDALAAAVRVLSIFAARKHENGNRRGFSSLFDSYPKIFQMPEWRPRCPDDKKAQIIKRVTRHFQKNYPCVTIDGVRIDFGGGAWAGIRQSNTSPKLSVCAEARSAGRLSEVENIVRSHMKQYEELKLD